MTGPTVAHYLVLVGARRDLPPHGGVPLQLNDILAIATQIASGLAAAHAKGIVHRDIKPQNILVDKNNHIKILDFGLAKLRGVSQLTKEASTLGTVHYMSPEQTMGKDVDQRSDIWSLGVVLYEMLSGRPPFRGDYEQAVIYSILNEEPEPVVDLNPEISPELSSIIKACLEKEANNRPRAASEIVTRMKGLSASARSKKPRLPHKGMRQAAIAALAASAIALGAFFLFHALSSRRQQIDSLAVLPFVNASGRPDMDYLGEGIPATLVETLSQLASLRVKSLLYASRYLKTGLDPLEIGRRLGVRALLTGSIRTVDDRIAVTVELTAAESGDHLWGKLFQQPLAEIVSLQQDLARDIGQELRIKISSPEALKLTRLHTQDAQAYSLYLQGCNFRFRETREDIDAAMRYFRQAVEKDPSFALGWAGLSTAYMLQDFMESPPKNRVLALAAAEKALALDPALAEAHIAFGIYGNYGFDWDGMVQSFKRAVALNPNLGNAHREYGLHMFRLGRIDEAVPALNRAVELEPLSWSAYQYLGDCYARQKKFDLAFTQYRKALEYAPPQTDDERWPGPATSIHGSLAIAYLSQGSRNQALAVFNRKNIFDRAWWTAISGDQKQLNADIAEMDKMGIDPAIKNMVLGAIYLILKKDDLAAAQIESLFSINPILFFVNFGSEGDPNMIRLRANPRYAVFWNKVKDYRREAAAR